MSGAREDRADGIAGCGRAAGVVGPLVPSAARSAALGRVGVGAGCAGDLDHHVGARGPAHLADRAHDVIRAHPADVEREIRAPCLIAHTDSEIFSPEDLAGKTFAFNDPNSTSGYLVPSAFFMNELGVDPKKHFSKLTFSGPHEASIMAVANKKVEVASTNLPDLFQITKEGKVSRGALRVIWVSKLIPNDPIVVRKDLPPSLKQALQESLVTMKARNPEAFSQGGAFFSGFARADDAKYQVVRELNDTAKRLAAQKP